MAVVTTAAAGMALALPAAPASATVTGAVVYSCTANLPTFPSATLLNGTCTNGTLPAEALGVGAGVDDTGNAYAVTGLGNFSAAFTYDENCGGTTEPVPPAEGTASGTATVTGLTATDSGAPLATEAATLTTDFNWMRVGSFALILSANVVVTFPPFKAHGTIDAGLAAFAPLPPVGNCSPGGAVNNQQAVVVGLDVAPV